MREKKLGDWKLFGFFFLTCKDQSLARAVLLPCIEISGCYYVGKKAQTELSCSFPKEKGSAARARALLNWF